MLTKIKLDEPVKFDVVAKLQSILKTNFSKESGA